MTQRRPRPPLALDKLLVPPDLPIINVVDALNAAHKRIILVADPDRRLLGVVTDSNIRRAILARVDFQRPVAEIMITNPATVTTAASDEQILALMESSTLFQIPVVDEAGRVVDVRFIEEVLRHTHEREPKTAVVMAGGLGQRLRPLTDSTPKPLLHIGDRPILFTLLDQLIAAGFDRVWITLNYLGDRIREAVSAEQRYAEVVGFVEETERLGTAGALTLLPEAPSTPLLVTNGDLLMKVALDEMMRFHAHERNAVTVALKEERYVIPYGVAKLDGTRVTSLEEKPEIGFHINTGVYVLEPDLLQGLPAGQALDMPDLIRGALARGRRVGCFPVHEYWQDIGQPAQLERARVDYDRFFRPGEDPTP